MPKQIQKSLQDCLSKLKISNKQIQIPFAACQHVRTTSFAGDEEENDDDGMDRFVMLCEEGISRKKPAPFLLESPRLLEPPPENLCRSARFFVDSGSSSSRITDGRFSSSSFASATNLSTSTASEDPEASTSASLRPEEAAAADGSLAPEDFIALLTYSPSPYDDFRQSMQEMAEMRLQHNGKVDWMFLEELLFCYLDFNNKKSYTFILQAFVDVVAVFGESSGKSPATPQPFRGGARSSSQPN